MIFEDHGFPAASRLICAFSSMTTGAMSFYDAGTSQMGRPVA